MYIYIIKMQIINKFKEGDLIVGYAVLSKNSKGSTRCIITCSQAKSFREAIDYYHSHFHREGDVAINIQYNKVSKNQVENFTMCA